MWWGNVFPELRYQHTTDHRFSFLGYVEFSLNFLSFVLKWLCLIFQFAIGTLMDDYLGMYNNFTPLPSFAYTNDPRWRCFLSKQLILPQIEIIVHILPVYIFIFVYAFIFSVLCTCIGSECSTNIKHFRSTILTLIKFVSTSLDITVHDGQTLSTFLSINMQSVVE